MSLRIKIPTNYNKLNLRKLSLNMGRIKEFRVCHILKAVINSYNLHNFTRNKMKNLVMFIKMIREDFKNESNPRIKILLSFSFNYLSLIFFKLNENLKNNNNKIKLFKKCTMIELSRIKNIYFKKFILDKNDDNSNNLDDVVSQLDKINLI